MKFRLKRLDESGFDHVVLLSVFVVAFALVGAYFLFTSLAATSGRNLKLDLDQNLCMNNKGGKSATGTPVILYDCSDTKPNDWQYHTVGWNFQLENVAMDGQTVCAGDPNGVGTSSANRKYIVIESCNAGASTDWTWSNATGAPRELQNAATGGCINDPGESKSSGTELIAYACTPINQDGNSDARWFSVVPASASNGSGGAATAATCQRTGNVGLDVANCAEYQLAYWNEHPGDHDALIDTYCDGNGACENGEWCAGFVSYVYREAGYGFGNVYYAYNFQTLPGGLSNSFRFQSAPALGAIQVDGGVFENGAYQGHAQIVVKLNPLTYVAGNYADSVVQTTDNSPPTYGYAVHK